MAIDGIIFDLDGTLIDTNGMHARAWAQTLKEFGYGVGRDRVEFEIGKGGSMLVPFLVGDEAEERVGDDMRDRHGELYAGLVETEGVRVYPRVKELLQMCRERGLKIAIATASKEEHLESVVEAAGLDLSRADAVVTDSDVKLSKPEPDVVLAAARKLRLAHGQCMMVGDTPYDGVAANRAGVVPVAVMTGVHSVDALRRSGMRGFFDDAADLLERLDEALDIASPGEGRLTDAFVEGLVRALVEETRASASKDAALLATSTGEIIAHATTDRRALRSAPLAVLLDNEAAVRGARDLILVSLREPDRMSLAAAVEVGIDTIVFSLDDYERGAVEEIPGPLRERYRQPRILRRILADEISAQMQKNSA